jgi:hemerythrin-like domain-containing protein
MDALQILRTMHAETKLTFRVILGTEEAAEAHQRWQELQPLLDLHERLEDSFVYSKLADEMGPGTPLGDWAVRHDADVDIVKQLIARVNELPPGTVEWRAAVGAVSDALNRHVMDEEGQIFGRIEQAWGPDRLAEVGQDLHTGMQAKSTVEKVAHKLAAGAASALGRSNAG